MRRRTYDFLFQRENIMVEKFVQLLVGVVDAQLFKRVDTEIFKSEYVEDT